MNLFPKVEVYTPYAGIGSRDTPQDILSLMTGIARMLDERGYILRSGGAEGADRAFDLGTGGMSHPEIYLPWDGFNGQKQHIIPTSVQHSKAFKVASTYHPAWQNCSEGARKMHVRNSYQILGLECDEPAKFVICWTKDGKSSGGTGQALRIAERYKVPIYNLFLKECRAMFYGYLGWEH